MQSLNRLKYEKSPYLLQHQHNPVHWFAWGEEAFQTARQEKKPIFLSVGYSTCHWCHVMEKDSFEREEVAQILNQNFVCIKVDREERPDVDEIYMAAVHAMGQRGGWPLSVFLTPDLKPFFGGTFWYRADFINLLERLNKIWKDQPEKIIESAQSLFESIQEQKIWSSEKKDLSPEVFQSFYRNSSLSFDAKWGGFGPRPKFPHATQLSMLLRIYHRSQESHALEMVTTTLEQMARGGIYDHLGGGFARYSTDERWLIPHFEKMLYDNALLIKTYLEAYQITKNELFSSVARETLDYVLRDMTHPKGGFYSAEDADSEGEEGKFYAWRKNELQQHLTEDAFEIFSKAFAITEEGNFEHQSNVLSFQNSFLWEDKKTAPLSSCLKTLFEIREKRIHPYKDDKILTAWNGLMISAFAMGYQVLGDERYLNAAQNSANFIKTHLIKDEKLLARYREGEARFSAYLDDYAFLIQALIDLYESDFNPEHFEWACRLQKKQNELFWDEKEAAYFFSDGQDPSVLLRTKEGSDGALPNSNAVSTLNLQRLFHLGSELEMKERAWQTLQVFSSGIKNYPHAFAQFLIAFDFFNSKTSEIAVIEEKANPSSSDFLKKIRKIFIPSKVIAVGQAQSSSLPLLNGKKEIASQTTFYLCQNQHCEKPTTDFEEVLNLLQEK